MIISDYNCPNCEIKIQTEIPAPGDVDDSLCICPGCHELHFKVVTNNHITTKMIVGKHGFVNRQSLLNIREGSHA